MSAPTATPNAPSATETLIKGLQAKHVEEVDAKLAKLEAQYVEYVGLKDYRNRLTGEAITTSNGSAPAAAPRKRAGSGPRQSSGQQASGGERTEQFLKIVGEHPEGITVGAIAKAMGMGNATYLYKLAPPLVDTGAVRKDGPKYFPVPAAAA